MNFDREYFSLGVLDAVAYRNSVIHRLDPRTKVIATLAFIVTVVSFPKYEIGRLVPFFLFPVLVFALSDVPVGLVLRKVLVGSVFAVFVGLFNPLLDTRPAFYFLGIPVASGWLSFFSIIVRFFLTLSAALLLISTTSFPGVAHGLGRLGVPDAFVSQLLFLYRYLFVLAEEAMRMVRARDLRSFGRKGGGLDVFVSLVGTLFVRTIERGERIHHAMLSRGFSGTVRTIRASRMKTVDFAVLAVTGALLVFFRSYNIVDLVGKQMEGVFR